MHCQLFRTSIHKFLFATNCIGAYELIGSKKSSILRFRKNTFDTVIHFSMQNNGSTDSHNLSFLNIQGICSCEIFPEEYYQFELSILPVVVDMIRLKFNDANMNHLNINTFFENKICKPLIRRKQ